MTDAEIANIVNDIFVECFEVPMESIKPEADIFADLGLDSLDIVDLIAEIQTRLKLQVHNDDRARSIRTLQNLYDYLRLVVPSA